MAVVFGTTLRADGQVFALVAARLAERMEMPLRLVHVSEDARAALVLGTDQEFVLGSVRDDLREQAEELHRETGAEVRPHLASGSVTGALSSLSEFELATVLLIGSSSRKLRDTADRLSRSSRVPLIVLREPMRLAAWLQGTHTLRILVGADFGRAAEAARVFAAQLAALGPIETEILYVAAPGETYARLGLSPSPDEDELSSDVKAILLRELSLAAPKAEGPATLRVQAARGRADAHLVARADEGHFDLVVVGQRRRSVVSQVWRDSIARGVLQASPVSVACVPIPVGDTDAWFRPPRVVVVGIELAEIDSRIVSHAIGYAEPGATVHLVHVVEPGGDRTDVQEARDTAWYQLSKLAADDDADERSISFETHVVEGRPAEQLLAVARRVGADLLVLGRPSRSSIGRALLDSVSGPAIRNAHLPVVLIPPRNP